MQSLKWLQEWYSSNCDGDWEHDCGIRITTIDNPGWHIAINLIGTELENKQFHAFRLERSEDDWIYCKVEKGAFIAAGGPLNLDEILVSFYRWATGAMDG